MLTVIIIVKSFRLKFLEWFSKIKIKKNMSDLFKSAFEYFSGPTNGQSENSFVGQTIEISNVKLKIKKVLAEGNFCLLIFS